jgi:hypothetical protein
MIVLVLIVLSLRIFIGNNYFIWGGYMFKTVV